MNLKLIVIGAGPGGYETALDAASRGIEVILIESGDLGGTCLNAGCIPTKSFCRNAEYVRDLHNAESFGITGLEYKFDFGAVRRRKDEVVASLRNNVGKLLENRNVRLVHGKASFIDEHTVRVEKADGTVENHSGTHVIVATGSVASVPDIPGTELPGVVTSSGILDADVLPGRLCVIGGGVIGMELASVFSTFGSKVCVLEYCKEILSNFDREIAKRLRQTLTRNGLEIKISSSVTGIVRKDDGILSVKYEEKGNTFSTDADTVLLAAGRKPNVESLNLEACGILYDSKGIKTDANMRTSVPNIYAIGDVTGKSMLAHAATFQGKKALYHILGVHDGINLSVMPAAVFTCPEIASVGMTEEQCRQQEIPFKVLKSFFRANGKAAAMGETEGFCKLIVRLPDSGNEADSVILGCHIIGLHASDLVQEICVMMTFGMTLGKLRSVIHAHPTLSEVVMNVF